MTMTRQEIDQMFSSLHLIKLDQFKLVKFEGTFMLRKYILLAKAFISLQLIAVSSLASMSILPPEVSLVDARNVNLTTTQPSVRQTLISFGGEMGMSYDLINSGPNFTSKPWADNQIGGVSTFGVGRYHQYSERNYSVTFDGDSYNFFFKNGQYSTMLLSGASLTSTTQGYLFVARDGTQAFMDKNIKFKPFSQAAIKTIIYPSGLEKHYTYKSFSTKNGTQHRIQSVRQSNGFMLKYNYEKSNCTGTSNQDDLFLCFAPNRIEGINLAFDFCDEGANSCSTNRSLPTATLTWWPGSWSSSDVALTVNNQNGVSTQYVIGNDGTGTSTLPKVKLKSITSENSAPITYEYYRNPGQVGSPLPGYLGYSSVGAESDSHVQKVKKGAATWQYHRTGFSQGDGGLVVSSSGPTDSASLTLGGTYGGIVWVQSNGTRYNYNSLHYANRLESSSRSSVGDTSEYFYDDRGNITSSVITAEGVPDITATANYPTICETPLTCNYPTWTQDPKGNQTDYDYYPDGPIGFLKKATKPASRSNVRPETRYFYVQKTPRLKNSSGDYVQSPPIWVLEKTSECKNGNANEDGCADSDDEVTTEYEYGGESGPNNLFVKGTVVTFKNRSLRTCYSYDAYGNKVSETTPSAQLQSCP